jgi:c-di-GMP-binding flagellar brake protein YcgR
VGSEEMGSEERRRHPRFDVAGAPGVLDGFRLFETLKISAGGMLIRLPAEMSLGQRVRVELPLGEDTFRSEARVVFFGPDLGGSRRSEDRYRVGLAFVEPTPADQERLDRFIAQELASRNR